MQNCQKLAALAVVGMTALAVPVFAQRSAPPGGTIPSQEEPAPKSDEHRIVGKVLQIDREQGFVKLATEEGILVVRAPIQALQAFNVGDIVSVPRSAAESPSTLPRE